MSFLYVSQRRPYTVIPRKVADSSVVRILFGSYFEWETETFFSRAATLPSKREIFSFKFGSGMVISIVFSIIMITFALNLKFYFNFNLIAKVALLWKTPKKASKLST